MKDSKAFPEGGVWDVLRSDEVFSDFLREDYEEASATSNKVAVGLNIAEHLRKLTDCISLIDAEIHNQVSAKAINFCLWFVDELVFQHV